MRGIKGYSYTSFLRCNDDDIDVMLMTYAPGAAAASAVAANAVRSSPLEHSLSLVPSPAHGMKRWSGGSLLGRWRVYPRCCCWRKKTQQQDDRREK
mmetsp:Transcript_17900/g.33308  ORF Transcript_17900/g.33308 Transcript_17900/m.33308 type:complete len:96 (-) Transcript_17900:687-974(-)